MLLVLAFACLSPTEHEDLTARATRRTALRDSLRATLGAAYDQPVPELATADSKNGQTIYAKSCITCHGGEMDGRGGRAGTLTTTPSPLVGPESHFYSDAGQVYLIEHGVPGTAMAAWGDRFGRAQVIDAYAYVLEQRQTR
jgi:mono/diheme cytochrome c family protein